MNQPERGAPSAAPLPFFNAAADCLDGSTDLCVLGVPYDHAVNAYRPVSLAPLAIRWQCGLVEAGPGGVYPWREELSPARIADVGDISFDPESPVCEVLDLVSQRVGHILDHGAWPLLLGGVHTISLGALGPCAQPITQTIILQPGRDV